MRRWIGVALAMCAVVCSLAVFPAVAQAATVGDVRTAIQKLSADPTDFKASDRARIEAIQADFESLSAADQAVLDNECSHSGTGQSLGRVLEVALWAVRSYDAVDNSTTLPDGTYDANSVPALSSEYSKGKSTSGRQKPWSVKSVTVKDGKATATLLVESTTYSGVWKGGKTYPRTNSSGNCEFAGVPIDLNSTFYFAGISTSMPTPIAFSLTTGIEEPRDGSYVLGVTSVLKTFGAKGSAMARLTSSDSAGVAEETLDVQLGMENALYDRVVYPSVINGALSDAEAVLQGDGTFRLVLKNAGDAKSFANGKPIAMKFRVAMAGVWVERSVTIDVDAGTIAIGGDELGADIAKKMIEALPYDPWKVTTRDAEAIGLVESVYNALSSGERTGLDSELYRTTTYGRALEQAVWALRAQQAVDNSTTLADGEYTGKVKSSSSIGKSLSERRRTFEVKKVTAAGGKATALIEYEGTSADLVLVGGQTYRHVNADEEARSQFEVPIKLNEPLYLVSFAKNPTDKTVGITYTLSTTADEASMKPDEAKGGSGNGGTGESGKGGAGVGAGGSGGGLSTGSGPSTLSRVAPAVQSAVSAATGKASDAGKGASAGARAAESSDAGESPSGEALFALTVLLVVCPLVTLVVGAAAFALWFARREVVAPVVSSMRVR